MKHVWARKEVTLVLPKERFTRDITVVRNVHDGTFTGRINSNPETDEELIFRVRATQKDNESPQETMMRLFQMARDRAQKRGILYVQNIWTR